MVNLWWNTVWLLDKTHLLVFNFWYRRLENIKTHISRHVLIRVRGPSHFDTWLSFILKTNKQKKNQQWCHTSAQCVWVCSVCVYFSVCVCVKVFAHAHASVLWSDQCFSRHSIRWSVMYVTGCVAEAEGVERGEEEGLVGGGEGGEVRPQRLFLHSQDFFTWCGDPG